MATLAFCQSILFLSYSGILGTEGFPLDLSDPIRIGTGSNSTEEQRIRWMPEPDGRGTMGIVIPCFITLSICVWTTVHLNVVPDPTDTRIFLTKLGWTACGIFAPEMILWTAYQQWKRAKKLTQIDIPIKRAHGRATSRRPAATVRQDPSDDSEESGNINALVRAEPLPTITRMRMKAAFYVVMGGCTLGPVNERFGMNTPLTILPETFGVLLEEGFIDPSVLTEELIADKSKSDGLTKLLVVIQATWLLLQCVGRLTSRLPLTILEVHTAAHVLCALATYCFWWYKPYGIEYPLEMKVEPWVSDTMYLKTLHPEYKDKDKSNQEQQWIWPYKTEDDFDAINSFKVRWERYKTLSDKYPKLRMVAFSLHTFQKTWNITDGKTPAYYQRLAEEMKGEMISWKLTPRQRRFVEDIMKKEWSETIFINSLPPLRPWSASFEISVEDDFLASIWGVAIAFTLTGGYGLVHGFAWNYPFATVAEKFLWRISAVCTAGSLMAGVLVGGVWNWLDEWVIAREETKDLGWGIWFVRGIWVVLNHLLLGFVGSIFVILPASRIILAVLSVISMRSLVEGHFKSVNWLGYWPHL